MVRPRLAAIGVALAGLAVSVAVCGSTSAGGFGHPIAVAKTSTTTTTTTVPQTTTTTVPPTTTTTIDPVCEQNAPIDGCPLGTPAAIAWAQQQDQAAQAAVAAQAEQAYEQCLNNDAQAAAAAIAQEFGKVSLGGTPTFAEPCSTGALTPAQIQQAQQAEGPSTQSNG